MRKITYPEYKRRVFNEALLECFCKIHGQVLNEDCAEDQMCNEHLINMAKRLCHTFFEDELKLKTSTVSQTKARLSEAAEFIKDCANIAEEIAEKKADLAEEEKIEVTDEDNIELSPEEEGVITQLFNSKAPTPQVDAIRDATVKALLAEDRKAEEIRQSIDIAQSKVAAGAAPETLEETVNRLNKIGPTSLMNAIMNSVSVVAIKDINKNGGFSSVGKVLSENADEIKSRAVAIYALYETSSVLGIHKYTSAEVKKLALDIFYEK